MKFYINMTNIPKGKIFIFTLFIISVCFMPLRSDHTDPSEIFEVDDKSNKIKRNFEDIQKNHYRLKQ